MLQPNIPLGTCVYTHHGYLLRRMIAGEDLKIGDIIKYDEHDDKIAMKWTGIAFAVAYDSIPSGAVGWVWITNNPTGV